VDFRLSPGDREPTAREKTLLALARNAGMVAILAVGLTYALSSIGVSVAPLLASAGVVGLAIGFGSQKLVQDIITGVFIQFENAINVGDVVEAGGKIGAVEKLTIRSVSLRDVAGVFHVIPFSSVDSVSNYMKGFSYHVADIGIAYREDIDAAKVEMLAAYDDLMADMQWETKLVGGLEWFGVESLGDSAVVLRARLKTRPGEQWAVGRAYTEIVKKRFDRAGIEIPYPHLTLWFGTGRDGNAPPAHLILSERAAQPEPGRHATASRQSIDPAGPTDADDADQP
jgi:small conductance mechanosensitive channel